MRKRIAALFMIQLVIFLPFVFADFTIQRQRNPASVDGNLVTISFNTPGENTTARVDYDLLDAFQASGVFSSFVEDTVPNETHIILLPPLLESSIYKYQIQASNGTHAKSLDVFQFSTGTAADTTPPIISNIRVDAPADDTSAISWDTDEQADSKVEFGETQSLGQERTSSFRVILHTVTIPTVKDRPYHYKITSCDERGNCAETTVSPFVAGLASRPMFIDAVVPEVTNRQTVRTPGNTKPLSNVKVYVDGQWKRQATAGSDGVFTTRIFLPEEKAYTIKYESIDPFGETIEKEYPITLDQTDPQVTLATIPPVTQEAALQLSGTSNELVHITATASVSADIIAPPKITGLNATSVFTNSVELNWDASQEPDLDYYTIYRDSTLITTTTDAFFIDSALDSDVEYNYEVAVVDTSCNEGIKSAGFQVRTASGGQVFGLQPQEINLTCANVNKVETDVSGSFTMNIPLLEGSNEIKVAFTDKAGNTVERQNTTLYDAHAPQIIDHNLNLLSPSYTRDVIVRGKVSEPATVCVYINDESLTTTPTCGDTGVDDTFAIRVKLSRKVKGTVDTGRQQQPIQVGAVLSAADAWVNNIRLIAVDRADRKSQVIGPVEVMYTLCGFGSWWRIEIGQVTPNTLPPRLMIENLAQIGIPVSVQWSGGPPNGTIRNIAVHKRALSLDEQKDWDSDWVTLASQFNRKRTRGYITAGLNPTRTFPADWTMLQKENNLSDHRYGDPTVTPCLTPGFGCVRIPLQIEIDFETPTINQTLTQRQCIDISLAIDRRVPSDQIPEGFLNASVEVLTTVIELIDDILEPVREIMEIVFYVCIATWIINFVLSIQTSLACETGADIGTIFGAAGFKKKVAQTGQCKKVYGEEQDKLTACESCQDALQSEKDFLTYMQWVCDRTFCPSAPTFQKYIKDNQQKGEKPKIETIGEGENAVKLDTRSDCADVTDTNYDALKKMSDEAKENAEEAAKLHPSDEKFCANEYLYRWDTACVLMNELEESVCLAAQNSGKEKPAGCSGPVWNAVAGFCEPDGTPTPDIVRSRRQYKDFKTNKDRDYCVDGNKFRGNEEKNIYYTILPKGTTEADRAKGQHEIWRGYISTKTTISLKEQAGERTKRGDDVAINSKNVFIKVEDVTDEFFQPKEEEDTGTASTKPPSEITVTPKFKQDFERCAEADGTEAQRVFEEIQNKIGLTAKTNVVEPTSGLLRSVQCVCLPAFTSYLSHYKNTLGAIRTCFQTILVTGDGSPGVCEAVLSIYVCDFIFELLSCFSETYGPSGHQRADAGIGSLIGALTGAGESVSNDVQGRYGEGAMFQAMFSERKLINSICLFAFTGTWDYDVSGMLSQDITIPISSQGFLYPCTRRFISFNPISNPKGISLQNYHFGVGLVAGADVTYNLRMFADTTPTCRERDGFIDGWCDGRKTGERSYAVPVGDGTLTAGEILDAEGDVFLNVQDSVRYNRAVLEWSYKDADGKPKTDSVSCTIGRVGGSPPAFCAFDFGYGMFLCSLDLGSDNFIEFVGKPKPVYPSGKNAFGLLDDIEVEVNIRNILPREEGQGFQDSAKYKRFLRSELKNQNTKELLRTNDPGRVTEITREGTDKIILTLGAVTPERCLQAAPGRVNVRQTDPAQKVAEVQRQELLREPTQALSYEITFQDNGDYTIHGLPGGKLSNTNQLTIDDSARNAKIRITFRAQPQKGHKYTVQYIPPRTSRSLTSIGVTRWSYKATLHEARVQFEETKLGSIATNLDGAPQKKSASIKVDCSGEGIGVGAALPPQACKDGVRSNKCVCKKVDVAFLPVTDKFNCGDAQKPDGGTYGPNGADVCDRQTGQCMTQTDYNNLDCTDPDGKTYTIKGVTRGTLQGETDRKVYNDECLPNKVLREYYCKTGAEKKMAAFEEGTCPTDCSEGRCTGVGTVTIAPLPVSPPAGPPTPPPTTQVNRVAIIDEDGTRLDIPNANIKLFKSKPVTVSIFAQGDDAKKARIEIFKIGEPSPEKNETKTLSGQPQKSAQISWTPQESTFYKVRVILLDASDNPVGPVYEENINAKAQHCGNGIIDWDNLEVCDWDEFGNVLINDCTKNSPRTEPCIEENDDEGERRISLKGPVETFSTIRGGRHQTVHERRTKGSFKDINDDFCDSSGIGKGAFTCDDRAYLSWTRGLCTSNCWSFRPLTICEEDDGGSAWYWPQIYITTNDELTFWSGISNADLILNYHSSKSGSNDQCFDSNKVGVGANFVTWTGGWPPFGPKPTERYR